MFYQDKNYLNVINKTDFVNDMQTVVTNCDQLNTNG